MQRRGLHSNRWSLSLPSRRHVYRGRGVFSCEDIFAGENHLEERLLDQAQARASYTPPFFGVVRVAYPIVWFLTSNICKIIILGPKMIPQ